MKNWIRIATWVGVVVSLTTGCASGPVYDSPPLPPTNVSPVESTDIVVNAQTTFVWLASDTAEYYEFHIFNNETNDIEQHARRNLRADSVCQGAQCSLTMSVALPIKKDHAWRVRAGNYAGLSGWTRTRFNMVESVASAANVPGIPSPIRPNGIDVKSQSLVEFVWRAIPEATGYDFHVFDAVNAEMVDALNDLPATTVCQSGNLCRITRTVSLQPSDTHAWRVRAVNRDGRSGWTRTQFKVLP